MTQSPAQHLATVASALDRATADAATLDARLAELRRLTDGRIAFSTSLGLEDQVILDAIARTGIAVDVFTLDTGRLFPETLDVLDANRQRYDLPIRVLAPDAAAVEALVARDGVYGFRFSIEARKACCDVRKVEPLRRALAGASAWITGLRRDQAGTRTTTPFASADLDYGLVKFNPLADWCVADVEEAVARHDIPVNRLHANGYPSIGCQPCTRAIRPGEDIRAGRWWWENEDGRECGLHNSPKRKTVSV